MAETQMKTAEEVASRIADEIFYYDDDDLEILKELTAREITAYAEERVKENQIELNNQWLADSLASDIYSRKQARTKALEDAANICIKNAEGLGCADEFYTDPDHDKVALAKAMLKAAALEIMGKTERK
jgi:hypothetical protein